jgi:hypothetical protein
MDYVIFAIDDNTNTHTVAKFLRHMDTKRAMGELKGNMVHCIGNWEGILEVSYILRRDDYLAHVLPMGFTQDQEAVMVAPTSTRQPASIMSHDLAEHFQELGPVRTIAAHEATPDVAWTFNTMSGKYFTA